MKKEKLNKEKPKKEKHSKEKLVKKNLKKITDNAPRTSLTLALSLFVFVILLSAIALTALGIYLLGKAGIFVDINGELQLGSVVLFMTVSSIVIGVVIAFFSSKIPLKPINELINKTNRLAAGDFKARLQFGNALSSHPTFKEISDSFNKMAEELENTELLRSDFINNFSHEFKTPIVSITGFAKLLSKGNLSEEQKQQYLKAIEEESLRLSAMATNVLNLTKVENQKILTDVSSFNLSEQIRSAVLILEDKWVKKNIDLQLDFQEYIINANEELLKEVWINLIDNAIKFSPEGGTVGLEISQIKNDIYVKVSNTGAPIPPEKQAKIFNKFYQTDESHSSKGNGIGLAIVKGIIELHNGEISVASQENTVIFTAKLPVTQN